MIFKKNFLPQLFEMLPCDFVTCDWREKGGRYVLYDEEDIKKATDKIIIKQIESLYRAQKHKAKENHNEFDYSRWHLSEKEMLRKRTSFKSSPFYWTVLNLYYCLSGYGEEPVRAGFWMAFLILLTYLLLGFAGLESINNESGQILHLCDMSLMDLWKHFLNTMELLLFRKPAYFSPAGTLGVSIKLFFQILIPIQATLFIFSLRNRFRR